MMFPAPPELSSTCIDLWLFPTEISPKKMNYLRSLLTGEEIERFSRFLMPAKSVEATVSRGVLRHVLSFAMNKPAREIAFTLGANGKPEVEDSRVRFNVSHTAGRVLLGVTLDQDIGVDIEQIRARTSYEELARRFFTVGEYEAMMATPAADRLRAFFVCWTRKEAVLKATGVGIAGGLATFEVPICPLLSSTLVAEKWHLLELDVGKDFVGAVVAEYMAEIQWNPVE